MKFPGEPTSENGLEIMTQTEFFDHPFTIVLIIYTIACLMFEYGIPLFFLSLIPSLKLTHTFTKS
jgi:hypothetical protein